MFTKLIRTLAPKLLCKNVQNRTTSKCFLSIVEEPNYLTKFAIPLSDPTIVFNILDDKQFYRTDNLSDIEPVRTQLIKLFNYNLQGGKQIRGKVFLNIVQSISEHRPDEKATLAVAWAIELLQACCLIADDIVDESLTRRGKPCWHRLEGLQAINDVGILREAAPWLLRTHGRHHKFYIEMIEVLAEAARVGYGGQKLDMYISSCAKKGDLSSFSIEQYRTIMRMKGAFTTLVPPVRLALYMASIGNRAVHDVFEEIAIEMSELFGMQDDFIDVYGLETETGKVGTDISNGKCTWLIVQALELAKPQQRKELERNYGQRNPKSVSAVKSIYDDLSIKDEYYAKESTMVRNISELIQKACDVYAINEQPFIGCLNLLKGRSK